MFSIAIQNVAYMIVRNLITIFYLQLRATTLSLHGLGKPQTVTIYLQMPASKLSISQVELPKL